MGRPKKVMPHIVGTVHRPPFKVIGEANEGRWFITVEISNKKDEHDGIKYGTPCTVEFL